MVEGYAVAALWVVCARLWLGGFSAVREELPGAQTALRTVLQGAQGLVGRRSAPQRGCEVQDVVSQRAPQHHTGYFS
jgi:hypothetical protein